MSDLILGTVKIAPNLDSVTLVVREDGSAASVKATAAIPESLLVDDRVLLARNVYGSSGVFVVGIVSPHRYRETVLLGGFSLPNNAQTTVTAQSIDQLSSDFGSAWSSPPMTAWTAPREGNYHMSAQVGVLVGTIVNARILLGGNIIAETGPYATNARATLNLRRYLQAGAVVNVSAFQNSGGAVVLSAVSFFEAALV
jgi:hypothetical protein